ncbi:MAG TPA: carboxylating nicotinate-nucleotide diphosphorylase [Tepidisphaeraceae bacterium]|jgi:nicotinate-nucleotide pyrophosphorylase (carboxylating)|nr:carboxylating nicotinate-nucleotide diphosphorylase [Tepidisphaeraceae bacterium]
MIQENRYQFPMVEEVRELILLAKREDMGARGDDVTSRFMIEEEAVGVGTLVQKGVGVVCGLPIVEMVCQAYDERLRVEMIPGFHFDVLEGNYSDQKRMPLVRVRGPMRALLSAERVVLNFLQHMSGVATLTNRYVKRVEGTAAKIYDTRKTLPGFRVLDKYAVRCGGGFNHRMGLYDGLLVKDNHLARVPVRELVGYLGPIVQKTRGEDAGRLVEIEVDTLEQMREVLKVDGVGVILLDNMDCPMMQRAVAMRDETGRRGRVSLEASGGITLETVRSVALTGVDRISIGAITHSAPALDIGLDVEE